ncbi:nectin-1-like [Pelodiscus sinensis]|uniref:nectin-1-like n=1 Tax=Pelodiscus sinensis TaxID=13735 RepID=UPI003F6AA630
MCLLTLLWIHSLFRALFTGANEVVRCERVPAAAIGEDVTLKCQFTHPDDVLQVTWQKLEGSSYKNIATYSKAHGIRFIGPVNKKVCFNNTSLRASSITLRDIGLEDETCYKCIFNAFPRGSVSSETCFVVQSIPAVRTELHSHTEFFTAACSVTAKPAPEISWEPHDVLIGQPEIHRVQNINGTVTVTSVCNVSMMTLHSKNIKAFTCIVNHTMGRQEKIFYSSEKYEASDEESRTCIWEVLCIFSFILIAIGLIISFVVSRKRKWIKVHLPACVYFCKSVYSRTPIKRQKSSSMLSTPAEKKHLNQDGEDRCQPPPTPKSQSISYLNEQENQGSSCIKRKTKKESPAMVRRSMFQEEGGKNEESNLNNSLMEGIKEMND